MAQQMAQGPSSPAAGGSAASDVPAPQKSTAAALALGSLGVVFGDIGTSPLYALRESLHHMKAAGRHRRRRPWHRLAAALGAVLYRDRQICPVSHASGQQRRGRHPFADGAGPVGRRPWRRAGIFSRRRRRRAVFRRRRHHTGDFGSVGARRARTRHADLHALCPAGDHRHPHLPVLGAECTAPPASPLSSARSWPFFS